MKRVKRFRKKGKLSPHYIGPYKIVDRIGKVAYKVELPAELSNVHLVFHVSMLKKSIGDSVVIDLLKAWVFKIVFYMKRFRLRFLTFKFIG